MPWVYEHILRHTLFDVLRLYVSSENNIYQRWVALTTIFFLFLSLNMSKFLTGFYLITTCSLLWFLRGGRLHLAEQAKMPFTPWLPFCSTHRPVWMNSFSSCPMKESTKPLSSNHGAAVQMDETGAVPVIVCGPDNLNTTGIFWHRLKPRGFLICSLLTLA